MPPLKTLLLCRSCGGWRVAAAVVLALSAVLLARSDVPAEDSVPQGADVIRVIFDKEPKEDGLTFDRQGMAATTRDKGAGMVDCWMGSKSVEPTRPWSRSIRFHVTDPRFQKGGRPVIDLEVVYDMGQYGEMDVKVDTIDGAKVLGKVWVQKPGKWQVYHLAIDGAYFGGRTDPNDVVPKIDGYDLALETNGGIVVRSVRLAGYNPDTGINWARMLQVKSLTAPATPGGVYLFPQAPKQELDAVLRNLSHVDRALYYKAQITDYSDKAQYQSDGRIKVPASSTAPVNLVFDTSTWPMGPYDGRLDLYLDPADAQPFLTRTFRLGVISTAPLGKARDGEFLYGLDVANSTIYPTHTPTSFAYFRLMGVDILRGALDRGMKETAESYEAALADLTKENLQAMIMADPPKDADPAKRQGPLENKTNMLEEIAKACAGRGPGKAHFFELGNEPDLPVFNPNSMGDYAESYYAMYDAIKQGARAAGAAPGDTQVMNGGLSFAGTTGGARSREFLEILDINKIDIIAYHGHGPGIEAERSAFERVHAAADKFGKAVKPFTETESGVSASDRPGLIDQARTVVEKMTYAQSVGEPLFMFFRLFMEGHGIEGGYGLTDNFVEPRPSVLSYRNMVERLRHFRFVKSLDFAGGMGAPGIDAFLFEERDANRKPTGRKTMVAFGEKPAQYDLRLALDQREARVTSPTIYDLFGNARPVTPILNIASVPVGLDPVFLCWSSPGGADAVAVAPPIISVDASQPILIGATTSIPVTLHNPEDKAQEVELVATVKSRVPAQVDPATQKISLPPAEPMKVPVNIRLGKADRPLELPQWWKVFPDVDGTQLTPEQLADVPDQLSNKNGPVSGQYALAENNHLDFAQMFSGALGANHVKRPAIAYAVFDSPQEVSLDCGASADWWMAWYLNGRKVYDDMDKGNLEKSLAVHAFTLPLKKGRNVLAVAVLSGSFGWSLDFGGPKELQVARTGHDDSDNVTITLNAGGKPLARQTLALDLQMPLPAVDAAQTRDVPADWMALEPLVLLEDSAVKNYWMKEPDSSKWYKGKPDLSGIIWLRDDGKNLHLFAAITDDKLVQARTPLDLAKNDSMRVVLADDAGKPLLDVSGGLVNSAPAMTGATTGLVFTAGREEKGDDPVTYYHWIIPRTMVGAQPFHLNIAVADNDSNFLKQTLNLGNVDDPVQGKRVVTGP